MEYVAAIRDREEDPDTDPAIENWIFVPMLSFGLLQSPVPVDARDLSLKIDRKFRYPSIRTTHAIDLAMPEVMRLATYRPLVFDDPATGLFCLASLSDDVVRTDPGLRLESTDYVPLALRAFPFGIVPGQDPQHQILIVEKLPEKEQNGEDTIPVFTAPGQLSETLNPHWEALKVLAYGKARLRYLIDALSEANCLEPWTLTLRFQDRDVSLTGYQIIRSVFWDSETYQQLLALHGPDMATLVHAHRLSLQTVPKAGWARKREAVVKNEAGQPDEGLRDRPQQGEIPKQTGHRGRDNRKRRRR